MRRFIKDVFVSKDEDVSYRISKGKLKKWIKAINSELSSDKSKQCIVSLRFLSKESMEKLNIKFRGVIGVTNVLAFPLELKKDNKRNSLMGDIAICIDVLKEEAKEQKKNLGDHLAHIFIHGSLHLLGFSHKENIQAKRMEEIEKSILIKLGIEDPYQ